MMQSPVRYNIYGKIHRALRAAMAESLVRIGRTDATDDVALEQAFAELETLLELCAAHLEHENIYVHAAMEARKAGSAAQTATDHVEHVSEIAALRREMASVRQACREIRAAAMDELYRHLSHFVADNYAHMLVEETQNNAVLWACYSDDEIHEIEHALVASIPPEQNAKILSLMVPAIAPPEREALLSQIRAGAPREVFEGLLAILLPRVPERDRARLRAALA